MVFLFFFLFVPFVTLFFVPLDSSQPVFLCYKTNDFLLLKFIYLYRNGQPGQGYNKFMHTM